ncbi:hypothetical protein BDY21DRAFT_365457 [Lineolata rhizophorae]|uniref:Uncharacterized protein n=1 Tax=Lineolata rhizophorae TaxID=578093 RepID=A0A6A6NUS4_9PEZI|nr:hypothetical protein BDY21DRAFT_365457 [Lineolata rhizophorae]
MPPPAKAPRCSAASLHQAFRRISLPRLRTARCHAPRRRTPQRASPVWWSTPRRRTRLRSARASVGRWRPARRRGRSREGDGNTDIAKRTASETEGAAPVDEESAPERVGDDGADASEAGTKSEEDEGRRRPAELNKERAGGGAT